MNESFRVGAVLLPKTLYKNVALVKYHLVSKLSQSRVLSSIILAVRFWNFCKLFLSVLLQPDGSYRNRKTTILPTVHSLHSSTVVQLLLMMDQLYAPNYIFGTLICFKKI
jgi:hypothetical protein